MARNREIIYVLRMRNESQAAIGQMANDLARLNQVTNGRPGGASSSRPGGGAFVGPTQAQTRQVRDHAVATGELTVNMRALTQSFVGGLATMTAYGVGGATVVGTLRNIIQAGDQANLAIGRMTATLGSRALAVETFDRLARSAAEIGVNVNDSVAAFQRFDMAGRNIGRSREDVLQFTETLQRISVVAGTTSQEASAAFLQLGQGLASGRLQGDELRSILENMPQVAQMIAAEMGVTIGEIRKLGEEGKIVPSVIFDALLRRQQQVRDQFAQLPLTVDRATQQMTGGFEALFREIDRTLGLSNNLARVLAAIGTGAQGVADAMAPATAMQQHRAFVEAAARTRRGNSQTQVSIDALEGMQRRSPDQDAALERLREARRAEVAAEERDGQNGTAARRTAEYRAQEEGLGELMRAEMRLAAHRQMAERDDRERQGRESEEARIREEARLALEGFGLANSKVAQQIAALRRVQDAGSEAMRVFGVSADQAGRMIEALQEKTDPVIATIRELRRETEQALADGGGSFQGELSRRLRTASQDGLVDLAPDQMAQIAEDLRRGALPNETQTYERRIFGGTDPTTGRPVLQRDMTDPALIARNLEDQRQAQLALNQAQAAGRIGMQEASLFTQAWTLAGQEAEVGTEQHTAALNRNIGALRDQNRLLTTGALREDLQRTQQNTAALEAQYAALQGNNEQRALEIEKIRVRQQLQQQGRTGVGEGDIDAQARANLQQRQLQFNIDANSAIRDRVAAMRDEVSLLGLSGDALEEQRLVLEFQAQARRQNVTLAQGEVDLIREGIREMQAIRAVRESDPVAGMIAGMRQWGDETRDIAKQVQDATVSMANGMTDAITEFAMTGKADFSDFARSAIRDMIRIAAQAVIVRPLLGAVQSGLGALFPASATVAGGDATASVFSSFRYHRGGIVGQNPGMSGGFDPGLWTDARRFHQGGQVGGLGVGERAIVAKDTEAVMPTVRLPDGTFGVRAIGGAGGSTVFAPSVEINMNGGGAGGGQGNPGDQQKMAEAVAKQVDQAIEAKMADFIATQRRAGGVLSSGMRI